MDKNQRTQAISKYTDELIIQGWVEVIRTLGLKNVHRVSDLLEVLTYGKTEDKFIPDENLNWDKLTEEDQAMMRQFLENYSRFSEQYQALRPARKKRIMEAVSDNLRGGK